jgi:prepilin-type N-terminal cleavage/methylation domain-containing protein
MRPKGTTFIEVMVSLFIFSVLILGTYQLILYSVIVQNRCRNRLASLELAANKIEYLKSLVFDHAELREGLQEEEISKDENKITFLLSITIKNISRNMKRIEVSSSVKGKKDKKITLAVYMSREIGF